VEELAEPSSKRILIVDDDEEVRKFLETLLSIEGYQVQAASDGNQALELVRKNAPDIIITDLMMPGSGGYDVVRALQTEEGLNLPVIVCTARNMDRSTEELIRAEANVVGLLHKPLSVAALQAILWNVLKVKPKKQQSPSNP
jgi:CheY-like chemotaxis protein